VFGGAAVKSRCLVDLFLKRRSAWVVAPAVTFW
jgi:hypothetical protein